MQSKVVKSVFNCFTACRNPKYEAMFSSVLEHLTISLKLTICQAAKSSTAPDKSDKIYP